MTRRRVSRWPLHRPTRPTEPPLQRETVEREREPLARPPLPNAPGVLSLLRGQLRTVCTGCCQSVPAGGVAGENPDTTVLIGLGPWKN